MTSTISSWINKKILKKFDIAKVAASHSEHNSVAMGAAIFKKNDLVSIGFNSYKTHSRYNKIHSYENNQTFVLHAEMSAILKARRDLRGCDIFVYREYKNGSLAMAKPCIACHAALLEVGIRYIYYTSPEGFIREKI